MEKIQEHIKEEAIICLQEVSETWLNYLYAKFAALDYNMFYSLYGDFHNDFMGVAIAYPKNRFQVENTKIINVGLTLSKL